MIKNCEESLGKIFKKVEKSIKSIHKPTCIYCVLVFVKDQSQLTEFVGCTFLKKLIQRINRIKNCTDTVEQKITVY